MQFGLQINPQLPGKTGNPWDDIERVARALDDSAFDSFWLYDHLLYEGGLFGHPDPEPVLECFVGLGAIAAVTRRLKLGPLVAGAPFRNPALLAKIATSLDNVSHGRTIFGIGASWHRREHEGYGWTWEERPVRMKRLEEAVQLITTLWTERPATFAGKFYKVDQVMDLPLPIQKPHPPILIGGNGEKVTLRLVAKYAQWCNVGGAAEELKYRFGVLREHCARLNHPPEEITFSNHGQVIIGRDRADLERKLDRYKSFIRAPNMLAGTPDELIQKFREIAAAGSQYSMIYMPDWNQIEDGPLLFAEKVIPALADP